MNIKPRHDPERSRFVVDIDGAEAVVDYSRVDDDTLNYRHTFVPPEHRGKGVASDLVRFALDYARDNKLQVVPGCPFVASFIEDNPEYRELLSAD